MRNSCLQQPPPAPSSAGALLFQAGVAANLVAHFRPPGPRSAPPGPLQSWAPARPRATRFPDRGRPPQVASQPRSCGFGGGVRLGCPSGLWVGRGLGLRGPRRAGAGAAEARSPGAPAERGGLLAGEGRGAARLSGAGLGSPRGDRAPQRALFPAPATPRTSSQPPPGLRARRFVFPAPRPPPDARAALGATRAAWGRSRSPGPAGSGGWGWGALGTFLGS